MKQLLLILLLVNCHPLSFCQSTTSSGQARPFVIGETDEIESRVLSEKRVLNIFLPEGYKADSAGTFPVVYLLDGGADEDFIHIAGLYQFSSFSWVNRVEPSIVVGIANTDRKRNMTYPTSLPGDIKRYPAAGHSARFISFIEQELQPYIQRKFRTNSSKTIIGESLGGLLATEILLKKPALFNHYIIVSPSLWWDDGSLLKLPMSDTFRQKTAIYIGVGKEGLTPGDIPHVMEVDANLLAEKIRNMKSKNVNLYFDYLPQEDHATILHQAVLNALRLMKPVGSEQDLTY